VDADPRKQVAVMRALWKDEHVTFKGKYHTIDDAGINPRPASGHLPVWYGGHHEKTMPRIAKWGDGWDSEQFSSRPGGAGYIR
jgi:alkanesulfonate monooxygenase SsuD/methylene tetrahydromethanopterin reductase-like flavin-dependent oxidoreductase (luciferase family)